MWLTMSDKILRTSGLRVINYVALFNAAAKIGHSIANNVDDGK